MSRPLATNASTRSGAHGIVIGSSNPASAAATRTRLELDDRLGHPGPREFEEPGGCAAADAGGHVPGPGRDLRDGRKVFASAVDLSARRSQPRSHHQRCRERPVLAAQLCGGRGLVDVGGGSRPAAEPERGVAGDEQVVRDESVRSRFTHDGSHREDVVAERGRLAGADPRVQPEGDRASHRRERIDLLEPRGDHGERRPSPSCVAGEGPPHRKHAVDLRDSERRGVGWKQCRAALGAVQGVPAFTPRRRPPSQHRPRAARRSPAGSGEPVGLRLEHREVLEHWAGGANEPDDGADVPCRRGELLACVVADELEGTRGPLVGAAEAELHGGEEAALRGGHGVSRELRGAIEGLGGGEVRAALHGTPASSVQRTSGLIAGAEGGLRLVPGRGIGALTAARAACASRTVGASMLASSADRISGAGAARDRLRSRRCRCVRRVRGRDGHGRCVRGRPAPCSSTGRRRARR